MKAFETFKALCEYLEGCRDEPPAGLKGLSAGWSRGLWWAVLAGLILFFCGQTSKFIYIDF
jgi:hypothetical protein